MHIGSSEIAVILSNSCLCLKQSQTLHQAKKKMSSSFYPSTCMEYACLNCVAESQGPSWSQIALGSFHAKIQGLITEGHCIVGQIIELSRLLDSVIHSFCAVE